MSSSIVNRSSGGVFINPAPLTKKGIQEINRQIHLIYTDKRGQDLCFEAVAHKVGGCAFGTIFAKKESGGRQWVGKIGDTRDLIDAYNYNFDDLNIDVIFEKLAYDLYEEFGRGFFKTPKTRLSELPLINQFGPTKPRPHLQPPNRDYLFEFIVQHGSKSSLRIMSKYVDGYQNFKEASTLDLDGTPISFQKFIETHHRPPETILNLSGQAVPIQGLMELIAVGRVLADTDSLGGLCDNAGFTWTQENGSVIGASAVKIDPGKALTCSKVRGSNPIEFNWVINTKYYPHLSTKLDNLKDIQTAQNYRPVTLHWDALTPNQKDTFLGILFNSSRYLQVPNILHYLFYRDGKFQHLPLSIAQQFQKEMKGWLELQFEIYADDLQAFHEKHPLISLRAHYIDACGELALPMRKETFPIRELFSELVIVDRQTACHAHLPDTHPANSFTGAIPLKELFAAQRRVLLIGRAGVGKSTLCQQIAHDWASGGLWNDRFEAVYWLCLRDLNQAFPETDTYDFLSQRIAEHLFKNKDKAQAISAHMKASPEKVLLILDGYDEAHAELAQRVRDIIESIPFSILLTSRPVKMETLQVDQIVENVGFSDDYIETYIDKFAACHDENEGKKLFKIIQSDPHLYPMAHIPLHLQMIVSLYEKTKNVQQASQLTYLYRRMTDELYNWHLRGEKQEKKRALLYHLGKIAHLGLQKGKMVISEKKVQHMIDRELLETGILKQLEGGNRGYYFIHQTFQEYLTALYASLLPSEKQNSFILDNRYKPSYSQVLAFLVGEMSHDPAKIQAFFATLCQKSEIITISPPYLLGLVLKCLNECAGFKGKLPALDTFFAENPHIWDVPLMDGYPPLLSAAFQQQTQALQWIETHYPHVSLAKQVDATLLTRVPAYAIPDSFLIDAAMFRVLAGISILAKCSSPSCDQYGKTQWISFGMGQFDITEICYTSACPCCDTPFDMINHCMISNATYSIRGRRVDGTFCQKSNQPLPPQKAVLLTNFQNWKYLKLELKRDGF